jgi:hypothetical protein
MPNVIAGKNSAADLYEEILSTDGILHVDTVISGGASADKQDEQTAHLAAIETAVEQIGMTRYVAISNWVSKIAFTGVAAAGITIQNFRVIDLNTSATLSSVWSNLATGLDLASPPVIDTEIEYICGTAVTLAEMQSLDIATQTTLAALLAKVIAAPSTEAKQDATNVLLTAIAGYVDGLEGKDYATQTTLASVLTELQLKADLSETQPVSLASVPSHAVTNAGTFAVQSSIAVLASDTPTSVASSAATVTLIAANANRRSLTIFNNSTAILYVAFDATATQAGAKVPIGAGGFYEMPSPIYTGVISGIWASANGNASIYEGV